MTLPVIRRVATLELEVQPWSWPFAQARRADIDAHFQARQREKPTIWNGRVLLGRNPAFDGEHLAASYFEIDFASFLAWRDWGFPSRDVFNGFGMGALRCADGAFVLGEMAGHTANAGRIYFPSGTPDPGDVSDGRLDMAGSVERETAEETGLTPDDYHPGAHWDCVVTGPAIAMIRTLHLELSGEAARERIEACLSRQVDPELSAIHLVRSRSDFNDNMPRFVTAFIESQWSA